MQIIGPAGGVVKLVGASTNLAIARAAYEAALTAITLDVGCFLALGHFGRTVARHPPAEPAPQVELGAYNAEYAKMREGAAKGADAAMEMTAA